MKLRPPAILDRAALRRAAFDHLARRSDSASGLARALARKIARATRAGACRIDEPDAAIEALVAEVADKDLLSDRRFAEGRATHLVRRGRSRMQIVADLAARGVARDDVDAALAELGARTPGVEREAAVAYARRRRLGPWRDAAQRKARRLNDLAALARAGFPSDIARWIVDAAAPDDLLRPDPS
jgi:regulatory protein